MQYRVVMHLGNLETTQEATVYAFSVFSKLPARAKHRLSENMGITLVLLLLLLVSYCVLVKERFFCFSNVFIYVICDHKTKTDCRLKRATDLLTGQAQFIDR